jgi:hypothetical protein
MLPGAGAILKIVLPKVIDTVLKQFKLDKVLEYVEQDNELDIKVKHLEEKIGLLEKMSHPPRDFTICDECKCKVVITEHIEERTK